MCGLLISEALCAEAERAAGNRETLERIILESTGPITADQLIVCQAIIQHHDWQKYEAKKAKCHAHPDLILGGENSYNPMSRSWPGDVIINTYLFRTHTFAFKTNQSFLLSLTNPNLLFLIPS